MKQQDILYAMTDVSDRHIEDAAPTGKRAPRRIRTRWVAAAACLAVCVSALVIAAPWHDRTPKVLRPTVSEDGVTIPPLEVTLNRDVGMLSDMIGFFIYGGRVYTHYAHANGTDMVGEYVGTATGMIDEWTKADGYVDFAGSVWGDFYTVKGFDPAFMLCMSEGNSTTLYINSNGMTLKTGADLYGERLHVRGNILRVEAETRESWYHSMLRVYELDERYMEIVERFIDALYEAPFVVSADIPQENGMSELYGEMEIFHMYLYLKDSASVPVHLRLFEGGYVMLQGLHDVCVWIEDDVFDELVRVLEKHAEQLAPYEAPETTT